MKKANITVRRDELRQLFEKLLQRLGDEIILRTDYYLTITTDEWDQVGENPKPTVGSLYDDWDDLQRLLRDDDRYFSAVDIERVGSILRAISEEIVS
ncbi:MAG TPA: hypothetical protein VKP65_15565 [Rhodothermales bacterium]|nr:hypothetical protein [Rhodothermales bacterium]